MADTINLEVNDVIRRLESVAKEIKDPKQRRRIVRYHARRILVPIAQSRAPKSDKPHFQYGTSAVKLIANRRTKKGSGLKRVKYDPGNLRGSIQVLPLRKTPAAIIGPKVQRKVRVGEIYGPISGRYNAYYAQMVYGSARSFRDRVMIPALVSAQAQLIKNIGASALKVIRQEAAKQNIAG